MTTEPRVLARDVPAVFAEHFNVPPKFARQVIVALKARDRIDAARPVAPEPTPRAIARIVLALTSPTIRDAADIGQALGAMPLSSGDGQPTLEDQIADMVEEAAGWRNGDTNFRDGAIVIGHTVGNAVIGDVTFRGTSPATKPGLSRFSLITTRAIASVARDLLPTERAN